MEELSFFHTAISELYGQHPFALYPLRRNNPEGKRLFRVDFTDGPSWVVRTYHQSYNNTDMFHWLSRSPSIFEWLQARTHTLTYVADQGYPAPVVVSTQTGAPIGIYEEWYILMTTFVNGDAKDTHPEKMAALSSSLGHLHTLPLPELSSANDLADSWWPIACLSEGVNRLASFAQYVPTEWQVFYNVCLQTFHYLLQRAPLPQTLIHGDCWVENGIQVQKGQAILIDWECAGLGITVLDFGSFLLHCHFDQLDLFEHEFSPQYQPDPQRIAAVVNGYYHRRQLLPQERDVLLEAIRFSIAWRGVSFFSHIEANGLNERLQDALRCWHRWYVISEEIAHIAHAAIERA